MKILIVKTSSLGDIIHTFSVLEYLHQLHPYAEIDWVVESPFAELLEAHPLIRKVIKIETKNWRKGKNWDTFFPFLKNLQQTHYDLLFDFQGNTKSGLVTFFSKAHKKVGFGKASVAEWPNLLMTNVKINTDSNLNIRQENLSVVQSYFEDSLPFCEKGIPLKISVENQGIVEEIINCDVFKNRKKIMVCPGSAWQNKQMTLSSLTNFLRLVEQDQPTSFLFVWGNEAEKRDAELLKEAFAPNALLLDRQPLPTLQNLMNQMDLVIAMDSLPLHLAGTTSVKTFGIFGASSARKYQPQGPQHDVFQGICPYGKTFNKRCPILRTCSTGACIRHTIELDVFHAFKKQFN